ncbi:MAG: NifB/NifX family molybdenum-iron cluster-binding protein [Brooklawnia sp.]|jgi:predicted Fe-Mo cluster-binding NifX family protein
MILTVPVTPEGVVSSHFGKATRMAVGEVNDGQLVNWQVHEVGWDVLHDEGGGGQHHARIVRFLKEQGVQRVLFSGMGASMQNTVAKMGLELVKVGPLDAREAVVQAAALQAE